MMTRIRISIANLLRRIANRLDPYDPDPMSLVPSSKDVVRAMRPAQTARNGLGGPGAADD